MATTGSRPRGGHLRCLSPGDQPFGRPTASDTSLRATRTLPVYGGKGGVGVARRRSIARTISRSRPRPTTRGPDRPSISGGGISTSCPTRYCASCHQVAVHPGIKLEVVCEQYARIAAFKAGIKCQHCPHRVRRPGVRPDTNARNSRDQRQVRPRRRKHSNHVFYGPGYSIAHPGIFPFHLKARRWWIHEWLEFDWRPAGIPTTSRSGWSR